MSRVDTKEMRLWAADIEERVPLTCKQLIRSAADELDELRKYQRRDLYSELAEALGSDEMDSHEGRLCRAKELAETRALTRERDEAVRALEIIAGVDCYATIRIKLRCFPHDLCSSCRARKALAAIRGREAPRPAPLSEEAARARAPRPPEELVGALQDRAHKEPAPECTCLAGDDGHDLDLNCPKHGREGGGK